MSKRVKIGKPDARVAPTRTDGASSPSQSFTVSFSALLALGLALRLILIVYGIWHDAKHELKYTDVDYAVFSDAAAFIAKSASNGGHAQGPLAGKIARWLNLSYIGSPYVRATYRYTPLLALLLVPNVYIHALWGKFLFCASDLVAAGLQYRILRNTSIRHVTARQAKTYVAIIWLLNPFVANISTRGSAESVLAVMVLASLATAEEGRLIISAILLGLSAHFKLYPVIYGIAMMGRLSSGPSTSSLHINLRQLRYAGTAAASFALMNALMYATWGWSFFEHAYLYHLIRLDHRHNFSHHFYDIYTTLSLQSGGAQPSAEPTHLDPLFRVFLQVLSSSFVPQMLLTSGLGCLLGFRRQFSLSFAWFMQTLAFVTFNRVCTSQYFMWSLCFLPMLVPHFNYLSARRGLTILAAWVAGQALWLSMAYKLEIEGKPVFLEVWMASVSFFCINIGILWELLHSYRA